MEAMRGNLNIIADLENDEKSWKISLLKFPRNNNDLKKNS